MKSTVRQLLPSLLVAAGFVSSTAAQCAFTQYEIEVLLNATEEGSWSGELVNNDKVGDSSGTYTECRECSLCGTAQECIRAGPDAGCVDCPAGRYNADRDPISGCDDCPEDTTSDPGAFNCTPNSCGGLCRKIIASAGGAVLGVALLGAISVVLYKVVAKDGRCRRRHSSSSCCCQLSAPSSHRCLQHRSGWRLRGYTMGSELQRRWQQQLLLRRCRGRHEVGAGRR